MTSTFQALALALALSVSANAALLGAWLGARDARKTVALERDSARADASACSDATEDLRTLADKRGKEAEAARAKAKATSATHARRADKTLSTAPAVPGDMCASMQSLGDDWLQSRAKP